MCSWYDVFMHVPPLQRAAVEKVYKLGAPDFRLKPEAVAVDVVSCCRTSTRTFPDAPDLGASRHMRSLQSPR